MEKHTVEVGEIREWLQPMGLDGKYQRFLVIEKAECLEWGPCVKVLYPDGFVQELWESDLLKDPDDPSDDGFSVRIEEISSYADSSACAHMENA